MTNPKPDARAARAAKRKQRERTSTAAPGLPTTAEGWIEYARNKVIEHDARPPVEARREGDARSGWLALADMIAREFRR